MSIAWLRPKVILWWGVVLTVAGALLVILLPDIAYAITQYGQDSSSAGVQSIMLGFNTVLRVIDVIIPPLGAALIAASAVMAYVRQLVEPARHTSD